MAEVIVKASTTTETDEGNVEKGSQRGDDAHHQPQGEHFSSVATSSSSSTQSFRKYQDCRRKPDEETSHADLRSLEKALRRESVVLDVMDIGPLTVPSTPVQDSGLDDLCNDVRINLELASVKLSKLAPTE